MTRLLAIPLLAAALALAACSHPTYFRQPLTPPGEAAYDQRLIGNWIAQSEEDAVYLLSIMPVEGAETGGSLAISAAITGLNPDNEHAAVLGWFNRIAHASVIDGQTYYNIRATRPGSAFVRLTEAGSETLGPEETGWFDTPPHADREYWIAKAEISGDGLLHLGFMEVESWLDDDEIGDDVARDLEIPGQGASYWSESCGEYCRYARADLGPAILADILRRHPADAVFALRVGPFAKLEGTVPKFETSGVGFK